MRVFRQYSIMRKLVLAKFNLHSKSEMPRSNHNKDRIGAQRFKNGHIMVIMLLLKGVICHAWTSTYLV